MAKRGRAQAYTATIRSNTDPVGLKLPVDDKAIFRKGFYWRKIAGSQEHLTEKARADIHQRSIEDLSSFSGGLSATALRDQMEQLSQAKMIEVSIPYRAEDEGWGLRTFPWESFLSYATAPFRRRRSKPFVVTRHLEISRRHPKPKKRTPDSLLGVCSAPGRLWSLYELEREYELVDRALGFSNNQFQRNPTLAQLQGRIQAMDPSIVHLAGIDPLTVIENADSLGVSKANLPPRQDGILFRDEEQNFVATEALELAPILGAGPQKPQLVSFASCSSAARLAPMALAYGAEAAFGFVGVTDDVTCGLFFPYFYRTWKESEWNLPIAFSRSLQWLRQQPLSEYVSGLALWSRESILSHTELFEADSSVRSTSLRRDSVDDEESSDSVPPPIDATNAPPSTTITSTAEESIRQQFTSIEIVPKQLLNYSLLHNAFLMEGDTSWRKERWSRAPYFDSFMLERKSLDFDLPVDVEVRLNVGEGDCVCRRRFDWPSGSMRNYIQGDIVLPLVANLQRQAYERLTTTMEVLVCCQGVTLSRETHAVTMLPADEWIDFDQSDLGGEELANSITAVEQPEDGRAWLASFSLPRDPAVLDFVTSSQAYLRTLVDDSGCGFDGYQRVPNNPNLAATIVDPQVRAFWSGLLYSAPLSYINPPPAYSRHSQRLRTPSTIFRSKTATCIDLALLFASVLEYIGVSPVIFLIHGHAFPGYWRSDFWCDDLRNRLLSEMAEAEEEKGATSDESTMTGIERSGYTYPWMYRAEAFDLIRTFVESGKLVPFESTLVTQRGSFGRALDVGYDSLNPVTFDCMIDIQTARTNNVTPLPILLRGNSVD